MFIVKLIAFILSKISGLKTFAASVFTASAGAAMALGWIDQATGTALIGIGMGGIGISVKDSHNKLALQIDAGRQEQLTKTDAPIQPVPEVAPQVPPPAPPVEIKHSHHKKKEQA